MAVAVPPPMPTSYPWWHAEYGGANAAPLRARVISSGCGTSGGNVQCAPESMRAAAAAAIGRPLSLAAYTLARYMTSEVGGGTPEEMVAVGQAAVNQARLRGYPDVNKLLLSNPGTREANRGWYGPIHAGGVSSSPYGRWASTSKDPHLLALLLADLVLSGQAGDFAQGATSQYGLEYLSDPKGKVTGHAAEGKYWVGPLAGVDHWRTFLFRQYPKGSVSPAEHQALLARGLWGVSQPRPAWPAGMPVETRLGLATFAIVGLSAYLAYRVMKRRGLI